VFENAVVSQCCGRSFIYIKKSNGPSAVPCGMPLKTADQSEQLLLRTTLCDGDCKKDEIHCMMSS